MSLVSTLAAACMGAAGPAEPAPANPAPVTTVTPGGLTVHVVQTGWVAVKRNFRDLRGPAATRFLSILADRNWTEWFPIQFYVIEHPEGVAVFDTGETAQVSEPGYFRCDPVTEWFYLNQLSFAVNPEDELGPQIERLGLDPKEVTWAVLSHLHSDHMGGMYWLRNAAFLISERDWGGHSGALSCRIPEWVEPDLVRYRDGAFGSFASSRKVTSDGALRVVPTPGHTPGHQSLMLEEDGRYFLFAGDAVFDLERLRQGKAIAGIVEDVEAARATVDVLAEQLDRFDTVLAPAHDHGVRRENRLEGTHGNPAHTH